MRAPPLPDEAGEPPLEALAPPAPPPTPAPDAPAPALPLEAGLPPLPPTWPVLELLLEQAVKVAANKAKRTNRFMLGLLRVWLAEPPRPAESARAVAGLSPSIGRRYR